MLVTGFSPATSSELLFQTQEVAGSSPAGPTIVSNN